MGVQESTANNKQDHKGYFEGWQSIDHLFDFDLVKNLQTNELGEARKYKLDPKHSPKQQLAIHQHRSWVSAPIVKSYSAQILKKISRKTQKQQNKEFCSKSNYIGVITERIPVLLSELPQISSPQALYLLIQCLKGYQYLYPRAGPVHVNSNMIGLNTAGNAKVWINQKFYQNHPSYEIKSLLSTRNPKRNSQYNMIDPQYRDQKEMIQNIIDVVQDKCENGTFPNQFHNLIRQNCGTFSETLNFINNYIRQIGIQCPINLHQRLAQFVNQQNVHINKRVSEVINRNNGIDQNKKIMQKMSNSPIVHFDLENNISRKGQQTQTFVNLNMQTNSTNYTNFNSSQTLNNNFQRQPNLMYQQSPMIIPNNNDINRNKVNVNFGNKTF